METLTYQNIAQRIYNTLQKKSFLSINKIAILLEVKENFLAKLTYSQKCTISTHELVGLLYQEVYLLKGFSLYTIEEIIKAEQTTSFSFYNDDFYEDEWFEAA